MQSLCMCLRYCLFLSGSNQFSRAVEIRKVEKAIEHEKTVATQAEGVLRSLETPDSLERFAREHYNMHADGEEVYLVD